MARVIEISSAILYNDKNDMCFCGHCPWTVKPRIVTSGGKAAGRLYRVRRLHGTLPAEPGRACSHEGDGGDPEEVSEGTMKVKKYFLNGI